MYIHVYTVKTELNFQFQKYIISIIIAEPIAEVMCVCSVY